MAALLPCAVVLQHRRSTPPAEPEAIPMRLPSLKLLAWVVTVVLITSATLTPKEPVKSPKGAVNLSPTAWPKGEYERLMKAQEVDRMEAGVATGRNGAVTVAYNGIAARAGLEALKQGGNALDAALTTAITQVAVTAGAP